MRGKDLRFILLFDLYGELLSDTQKEMFDLYYNDDLSLSEVAENTGITRQGVRDSIKRSEETLLSFEEKLGLAEKLTGMNRRAEEIRALLLPLADALPEKKETVEAITSLLDSMKL